MTGRDDSPLTFADGPEESAAAAPRPWLVMIVDDEPEVHSVTHVALDDFAYHGAGLRFLSAYSAREAWSLLLENPDVALILLDVVMETDEAGLELARRIRSDLGNHLVRIILRTGQPGVAPERQVIVGYDINDYKDKTELTADRLFSATFTALRAYEDLATIERHRDHLEDLVAERTRNLNLVLESMGEGLFRCDTRGIVTLVNTRLTELLGRQREALLGLRHERLLDMRDPMGDPYPAGTSPLAETLRDGRSRRVDGDSVRGPDGERVAVDLIVSPVFEGDWVTGAVCSLRDVRDRQEAFDALGQQVSQQGRLLEALSEPVFYTDGDGMILNGNDAFAHGMGAADRHHVLGRLMCEVLPEEIAARLNCMADSAGVPTERLILEGTDMRLVLTPMTDEDGTVTGVLGEIRTPGPGREGA